VTGFDAGIDVQGGIGNTVTGINAHDNINDNITTNNANQQCIYGDGIITEDSANNVISNNTVTHNGPYDGVTLVGDSDGNNVTTNTVADNNIPNEDAAPGFQGNGSCGSPFSRPIQDIGIRVEGPGANNNTVQRNTVTNSAIGGITIHGYVYNPPSGTPDQPNTDNLITNNTVTDTGKTTHTVDPLDGIGVLRQGPANTVGVSQGNTIQNNTVDHSYGNGIFLGNPTQSGTIAGNTVRYTTVTYSWNDGIRVASGALNNTLTGNHASNSDQSGGTADYDGHDLNANCDNNAWHANVFTTFSPACVAAP
jgi:parallel beta-helix repeat protein